RPFGQNANSGTKPNQRVLEACTWYLAPIDGRPSDKFTALSLVQQHITDAQPISLVVCALKVHPHHIGGVNTIIEHVCDPEVRRHVGSLMVLGSPLSSERNTANRCDA